MASQIAFGEVDANGVLQLTPVYAGDSSPKIDLKGRKIIEVYGIADQDGLSFQFAYAGVDGNMFVLPQTYSVPAINSAFKFDVSHTEAKFFQVFASTVPTEPTGVKMVVCFK